MKYLTIHNALEDAATFIGWAKENLLLPKGKWMAVGGSYPGMLAAFFRETHPEIVSGAWASSAPVNVQLSFGGYDAQVARGLPADCLLLVRQANAAAEAAYDAGHGEALLQQLLGGDYVPSTSKADYMASVADSAAGAVQYGGQNAFCSALAQYSTDPLSGLIAYSNPPLDPALGDGLPPDPKGATGGDPDVMLATFGHPVRRRPDGSGNPAIDDPWLYQVCTEVGFYQIHNPQTDESVMSPLVNEDYFTGICDRYVMRRPDVATTLTTYYQPLATGKVTNVLFVNGEFDPWSVLSFVDGSTLPAGLKNYVVARGSHCTDLSNLKPTSLLGDFEVHALVKKLATEWLAP
jgi:hypothetical protein